MTNLTLSPLLRRILPLLVDVDVPVYLVGGAVRDALLGRVSHDLDFAVPQGGIALAFRVADALHLPAYVLDEERDVGRVIVRGELGHGETADREDTTLDFARFRGPDLAADLHGRDFTVNALAVAVGATAAGDGVVGVGGVGDIVDYFGGLADLAEGRLRIVHDASLRDDPVRALRAVRLAESLGFRLTAETETAVGEAAGLLAHSSAERVRDELVKMMGLPAPYRAVERMWRLGLLAAVLPEIAALEGVTQSPPHHEDVLAHTISVLRWLPVVEAVVWGVAEEVEQPENGWHERLQAAVAPHAQPLQAHFGRRVDGGMDGRVLFRLGALFHDCGKKGTRTVEEDGRIRFFGHEEVGAKLAAPRLNALAFSNEAIAHVRAIITNHMRPHHLADSMAANRALPAANRALPAANGTLPSRRAVYRYFRSAGSAGLDAALLALADDLARYDGPGPEEEWQRACAVVGHLLDTYFTAYEEVVRPPRLVDGKRLMDEFGLSPGPEIGRLLNLIQEAQAAGEVVDAEGALALAGKAVRRD